MWALTGFPHPDAESGAEHFTTFSQQALTFGPAMPEGKTNRGAAQANPRRD
jgi:hypothetical protein